MTQCFAFASSLVQVPSCVWIYLCAYMWQLYQCRCQCHGLHFSCYYACSCHLFNFIYIAPFLLPCMVCIHSGLLYFDFFCSVSRSVVRSVRCFLQLLFFFISFFLLVFRKYAHLSNTLCVACRSYTTHISSFSSLFCNTFIFCFIYFSHRTQSMHIIFPLRDTGAVDECSTVPSLARCVLFFAVVAVRFIYMAILHCDCDCHCYHLRLIFCSCSPTTFFHRSCKNSKHSKREQLPTACA